MKNRNLFCYAVALAAALTFASGSAWAQQVAKPAAPAPEAKTTTVPKSAVEVGDNGESIITLSPFEVSGQSDNGYGAATTLAGNRLNTELRDIGNAVTVVTGQFLKDIGATDNQTLLQYTTGTEVGNSYGNFAGTGDAAFLDQSGKFTNPNQNTRIRGLAQADNARDNFTSDIPWDGFSVDRVDLQRGPNSIMFGQGSPAGLINAGTKQAKFRDFSEVGFSYGSFDSNRETLDLNRVLIKDELALRFDAVRHDERYKQQPAHSLDKRIFSALRWEPALLKRGSARTIIKATIEAGNVASNNPRTLPPIDLITPWFATGTYQGLDRSGNPITYNNLNKQTFNAFQVEDDNTGRANHGQQRPSINGGVNAGQPNPYFNPWIGNFGQSFGGPVAYFSGSGQPTYWLNENRQTRGIKPDGTPFGGGGGGIAFAFHRMIGLNTQASFANFAGLPFGNFGVYKDKQLTDNSIFDFYNQQLDGPNKKEWQNFRTYNISIAQTFFHDQFGIEAIYNKEFYKSGQLSLLSGEKQAVYIDMMSVFNDGTPAGKNGEPFQDGTPNPNVGRPFISDSAQFGNNSYRDNAVSKRATAFVSHDFTHDGDKGAVMRFLGKHTITGLMSDEKYDKDNRNWERYAVLDQKFRDFAGATKATKFNDNLLTPNNVIYLGPSLMTASSAAGAAIPSAAQLYTQPSTTTVRMFDSTWNHPLVPGAVGYVDPAAPWTNAYYPDIAPFNTPAANGNPAGARFSTQSANPANYVGYTNVPFNITDSEASQTNRDALTTSAKLSQNMVSTSAAVWQAHFWNNLLVGTYGIRKDEAKASSTSLDTNSPSDYAFGQLNLTPSNYKLPDKQDVISVTSRAWTAVAHISDLFGNKMPFRFSVFYNKSTNFQPLANRVDTYGNAISAPKGKTTDKGVLLESKDGRYSLKINKYETAATNAASNGLGGAWFIGASQAWAGNWANRFEFNWTGDTNANAVAVNDPTNSQYNYGTAPGETLDQAAVREQNAVKAWRAWQKSVNPAFYTAWKINLNDPTQSIAASNPNGFALTEDSLSKGYEIELNAQPTRNWRLTLNVAKSKASRANIGGASLADFISKYQTALNTTAAGDLRIWWGGAGNETTLYQWNNNIGSEYAARHLQEGTNAPELREWHANAITNYDFTEGRLRGVNVGMGYRWQSSIVVGYRPLKGATPSSVSFDIANPYRGPADTNLDFWVGYRHKIMEKYDWDIQLNLRNAFVGNKLTPITVEPDGSPAGYRITPPQTWTLSNTVHF